MEKERSKKKSVWSWSIDETELKKQIENYQNLKITESYRGISVLIIFGLLSLSLLLAFFGVYADPTTIFYGLVIYVPILFFVYKGQRWAIVALMILWTFEKIYQIYETGGDSGIMPIIWWLIVTPYFWKALRVENGRRKLAHTLKDMAGSTFCHKCGEPLEVNAKFCSKCGANIFSPSVE